MSKVQNANEAIDALSYTVSDTHRQIEASMRAVLSFLDSCGEWQDRPKEQIREALVRHATETGQALSLLTHMEQGLNALRQQADAYESTKNHLS